MKTALCLAIASLALAPLCLRAADEKPKPKAKPKAETPAAAATAADLVDRIEKLLDEDLPENLDDEKKIMAILKQRIEAMDKMSAEFREKFPADPLRWKLQLLELKTREAREQGGFAPLKDQRPVTVILAEIAAAPDAAQEIKEIASTVRLQELMHEVADKKLKLEDWEKDLAAHVKAFPGEESELAAAQMRLSLVEEVAEDRLPALLEELAKSKSADIAEMAKGRLATAKAKAELKTKPLELKFKALDDTEVDLEKLRGKVVLVDFWATWCGPCMQEMPNVVKAYAKLKEKGFEIIGISLDESKADLKRVLKEKKVTWPQYFDGKGWMNVYAQKWGIDAIPAMWLINKKGMVVDTEAEDDLESKVEKLLAE